jgi:hypothetical protein
MVVGRGQDLPDADVTRVDQVGLGQQVAGREVVVAAGHGVQVGGGGVGGGHMRDQVWPVGLARLGEVGLVAAPVAAAFDARPGVEVVGGEDHPAAGGQAGLLVAPAHLATVAVELLDPGRPQDLHRLHAGQPDGRVRGMDHFQQPVAVPANLNGPFDAGVLGGGQPPIIAALAVASRPLARDQPTQPGRRHDRQGLQRGAEGLDDLLKPVKIADRHVDVGRVGALTPALAQQAAFPQPIKQQRQQPLGLAIGEQSRAELGEHRGVKARVRQVKAQRVLPVQPCSHRVGGLPIGEALDELQHQHQRQPGR